MSENKYKQPRITAAKMDCECAETKQTILKGMDCLITYCEFGIKAFAQGSDRYKKFVKNGK